MTLPTTFDDVCRAMRETDKRRCDYLSALGLAYLVATIGPYATEVALVSVCDVGIRHERRIRVMVAGAAQALGVAYEPNARRRRSVQNSYAGRPCNHGHVDARGRTLRRRSDNACIECARNYEAKRALAITNARHPLT